MYTQDFTNNHDYKLIKLLQETKSDFIYFNYLNRVMIHNQEYNIIPINNKTASGQGRSKGSREVEEVIITNMA